MGTGFRWLLASSWTTNLGDGLMMAAGPLLVASLVGGLVAQAGGIVAPWWFAFAGSGLTLALVWRELAHIAHADEEAVTADSRRGDVIA